VKLSIIVVTCGRVELGEAVRSVAEQTNPDDEVLIGRCAYTPEDRATAMANVGAMRNRLMREATGDWLMFLDDDDVYFHDALDIVRSACSVQLPHIFRMRYPSGAELWIDPEIRPGNVGTPMFVIPNLPRKLGKWTGGDQHDYDFILDTVRLSGDVVWRQESLALIAPAYGGVHGEERK